MYNVNPDSLLFGGFLSNETYNEIITSMRSNPAYLWSSSRSDVTTFIWVGGNCHARVENSRHLIISLGHISGNKKVGEGALREIERFLLRRSFLPLKSFEGSFALIVVDKFKNKIMIYRNIVGLPCVYYLSMRKLTLFSDSISFLTQVINTICPRLPINRFQVPSHLLYGVTGRETLFKHIRRIMVGEQIFFTREKTSGTQLLKLSDMIMPSVTDCVEHLESVMKEITTEYVKAYPNLVNMFSGGVDSSYIQAHLCKHLGSGVRTFSLDLVHPSWEAEREYARSGSTFFQTNHTFLKVKESQYPELLTQTVSMVGLPPRNPQRALCYRLFKSIKETSPAVVCGMGADSLFGLGISRQIDAATLVDRFMPFEFLRQPSLSFLRSLYVRTGARSLEDLIRVLQVELHDLSSPKHPAHMIATDHVRIEGVTRLFGIKEVARATHLRQVLMRLLSIKGSLKQTIHSLSVSVDCPQIVSEQYFQLASQVGLNILHPYLDSRMIRGVLSFQEEKRFPFWRVKNVIKQALRKYVPQKLVRKKSGWSLPILEWMKEGEILHPFVKDLEKLQFARFRPDLVKVPNGFVWDLISFHIWLKQFISTGSH